MIMQQLSDVSMPIYISRVTKSSDSRLTAMEMLLIENGHQMQ